MKKYYSTTFLLVCIFTLTEAQITNKGEPLSWSQKNLKSSTSIQMQPVDMIAIQKEDAMNDLDRSKPWRFGYEFNVDLGIDDSGTWDELPNGDRIWRINIISSGAKTLNFIFNTYKVPTGASVYLYNNDRTDLLGAYTNVFNREDEMLGTWVVEGDNIWIEYYEPKNVRGEGRLNIGKVVHGYRMATDSEVISKALNDSGNCNLDVDCSIGSDLDSLKDRLKHSVAFIILNGFVCSGQLINNTNNDKAPYFLTANHCNSGSHSTWAFRFNWISPNPVCASTQNSTNATINQTTSGATVLASNLNSDVKLLQLDGGLGSDWDLEWAGWDRTDNTPNKTMGIHHPSGDIMKVCRDDDSPLQGAVNIGTGGSVQSWAINGSGFGNGNGWDLGVTEGGSSGSALFDDNGRIIGQLAGGNAACSGVNDNGGFDVYGRFAVSWNDNNFGQWLDPSDTGATTLNMLTLSAEDEVSLKASLRIFPNPSTGILNVTNMTSNSLNYKIISILGKTVKEGILSAVNNEIDLSSINNGIYIVKLNQRTVSTYKKIILSK